LRKLTGKFGASVLTIGVAHTALAAYVNYTLVIDPDATDRVQINLPVVVDYEEDTSVKYDTRNPSVYVFQDFIMNPHTNTGWHIHPGLVLITIADGSVDWYDSNCVKHFHKSGDFFRESDQLHFVQNASDTPARLIITYIIAKGETNKIYQPAPSCAAALGLDIGRISAPR
jgi:quercetin dioxygenase-like cupin family protein